MKSIALTIAAGALGVASFATPALADHNKVRSTTVSYADLNLSTAEGQKRLERRVEIAAQRVCGFNNEVRASARFVQNTNSCLKKARASARAQVAAIIEDQRRGG